VTYGSRCAKGYTTVKARIAMNKLDGMALAATAYQEASRRPLQRTAFGTV
jgi:hypothetical protein